MEGRHKPCLLPRHALRRDTCCACPLARARSDHLDKNTYWLKKDGLSRDRVPAPLLESDRCSLAQWTQLLDDIDRATYSTRCNGGIWCLLGGMCCSPLALCYCYGLTGALKAKYGTICSRFQDQTGLRINVSSFMSYWEMNEMPPKDRCMQPYERENDRGVVIFQINV